MSQKTISIIGESNCKKSQNLAFSNQPRLDEKELGLRNLKARVAELEEERDIPKSCRVFRKRRRPTIYTIIRQQSAFHSVQMLCCVLSLSTSSYYRWLRRPVCKRQKEDIVLSEEIKNIFDSSRSTYGSPRIQRVLRNERKRHGQIRIRRLMNESGLKPKAARKFKVTTDSNQKKPVALNILGQKFKPIAPNVAWASDITYIKTNEGWLYLATVIELYSRKIIGWSMSTRLQTDLIVDALSMAIVKGKPPQELYCTQIEAHSTAVMFIKT